MATIADLQTAVAAEDNQIAAVTTLVQGLIEQVAALPTTDPVTQAAIDSLVADATAQTEALAAAVASATPLPVPPLAP